MDLIGILVSLLRAAWPLPDMSDRASVVEFAGRMAGAIWDLRDKLAAELEVCGATPGDDLWEAVAAELEADTALCATAPGKIGDGTILRFLIENGPAIMALITQIIAMFPKKPTPQPSTDPVA